MVESIDDMTDVIANASPTDKAALYKELGIELIYQPDGRLLVEARPRRLSVCVEGAKHSTSTRDPWEAWLTAACAMNGAG